MGGMLFFFFVVVFLPCFSLFALLAIVLKGTEQQFLLKPEFGDNNWCQMLRFPLRFTVWTEKVLPNTSAWSKELLSDDGSDKLVWIAKIIAIHLLGKFMSVQLWNNPPYCCRRNIYLIKRQFASDNHRVPIDFRQLRGRNPLQFLGYGCYTSAWSVRDYLVFALKSAAVSALYIHQMQICQDSLCATVKIGFYVKKSQEQMKQT